MFAIHLSPFSFLFMYAKHTEKIDNKYTETNKSLFFWVLGWGIVAGFLPEFFIYTWDHIQSSC
jgi:hypothetical protein